MPELQTMVLISTEDLMSTSAFIVMLMAKEMTLSEIQMVRPDATQKYVDDLRKMIGLKIMEIRNDIKKKKAETN
jgi:hypothetical protein